MTRKFRFSSCNISVRPLHLIKITGFRRIQRGPNEAYSDNGRRKFENQFRLHLLFESLSLELAFFPREHVISYSIDGDENPKNKIKYTKDK